MRTEEISLPTTRKAAIEQGLKHYFTGKTCPRGHVARRLATNRMCSQCGLENGKAWREANPEAANELRRRSRVKPEQRRKAVSRTRRWLDNNPERASETKRRYRDVNRERDRPKFAAHASDRRGRRPEWQPRREMLCFYESARRVSACLGIPHQVDHIVPLFGKLVSGLHVPGNLRVIPAVINQRKSNKVDLASAR